MRLTALFLSIRSHLKVENDRSIRILCDVKRVSKVISVATCHNYLIDLELLFLDRREWISRDKRIDEDLFASSLDKKACVTVVG